MLAKSIHSVKSKGRVYVYAWRGGPRLYAEPGSPAFLEELAAARAPRVSHDRARISGLIALYKADDAFEGLSAKQQKEWRRWLTAIEAEFGDFLIKHFDSPKIIPAIETWRDQWKATPRTADVAIEVMSRLLSFGARKGKLSATPCAHVPRLYKANRADKIWMAPDLAALASRASPEVYRAAQLAALTGLRRGDLLRLSWSHVGKLAIEIPTGKSGRRKTTLIPIYAELRAALASVPRRAGVLTVLTTTAGLPWKTGFGASWTKAKGTIPLHFHDLRGTAATKFFLAGLSPREIAEIMTWSEQRVETLINRYVKRDEILLARIRKLDGNAMETEAVKIEVKPL